MGCCAPAGLKFLERTLNVAYFELSGWRTRPFAMLFNIDRDSDNTPATPLTPSVEEFSRLRLEGILSS
jgi:hypothetical protein